eukprot:TRINITY_DN44921_c0_g1_i1.p1 TRINITY_DN44921_c0_g1~~TRINITY_DN44921_c0_g1_i1.p1  ORF type:complete len:958 (-),score=179.08 TRINITY_DN44921_c0_g1_i1:73-2946(-)
MAAGSSSSRHVHEKTGCGSSQSAVTAALLRAAEEVMWADGPGDGAALGKEKPSAEAAGAVYHCEPVGKRMRSTKLRHAWTLFPGQPGETLVELVHSRVTGKKQAIIKLQSENGQHRLLCGEEPEEANLRGSCKGTQALPCVDGETSPGVDGQQFLWPLVLRASASLPAAAPPLPAEEEPEQPPPVFWQTDREVQRAEASHHSGQQERSPLKRRWSRGSFETSRASSSKVDSPLTLGTDSLADVTLPDAPSDLAALHSPLLQASAPVKSELGASPEPPAEPPPPPYAASTIEEAREEVTPPPPPRAPIGPSCNTSAATTLLASTHDGGAEETARLQALIGVRDAQIAALKGQLARYSRSYASDASSPGSSTVAPGSSAMAPSVGQGPDGAESCSIQGSSSCRPPTPERLWASPRAGARSCSSPRTAEGASDASPLHDRLQASPSAASTPSVGVGAQLPRPGMLHQKAPHLPTSSSPALLASESARESAMPEQPYSPPSSSSPAPQASPVPPRPTLIPPAPSPPGPGRPVAMSPSCMTRAPISSPPLALPMPRPVPSPPPCASAPPKLVEPPAPPACGPERCLVTPQAAAPPLAAASSSAQAPLALDAAFATVVSTPSPQRRSSSSSSTATPKVAAAPPLSLRPLPASLAKASATPRAPLADGASARVGAADGSPRLGMADIERGSDEAGQPDTGSAKQAMSSCGARTPVDSAEAALAVEDLDVTRKLGPVARDFSESPAGAAVAEMLRLPAQDLKPPCRAASVAANVRRVPVEVQVEMVSPSPEARRLRSVPPCLHRPRQAPAGDAWVPRQQCRQQQQSALSPCRRAAQGPVVPRHLGSAYAPPGVRMPSPDRRAAPLMAQPPLGPMPPPAPPAAGSYYTSPSSPCTAPWHHTGAASQVRLGLQMPQPLQVPLQAHSSLQAPPGIAFHGPILHQPPWLGLQPAGLLGGLPAGRSSGNR